MTGGSGVSWKREVDIDDKCRHLEKSPIVYILYDIQQFCLIFFLVTICLALFYLAFYSKPISSEENNHELLEDSSLNVSIRITLAEI